MMLISECDPIIGCITAPTGVIPLTPPSGGTLALDPIISLLTVLFDLIFIAAGLFAFFQLVTAGYQFMNAGGDAKQVSNAWNKITQTLLGIIVMVSSFLLIAIMGQIFFGDWRHFLQPTLFIPPPKS